MSRYALFISLLFVSLSAVCQVKYFYNINGNRLGSSKDDSVAFYSLEEEHLRLTDGFKIRKYYLNGQVYSDGYYKYNNGMEEHGEYISYHLNGNRKSQGRYEDDGKVGEWSRWYLNGNKQETLIYDLSKDGINKAKVMEFYDSLGNQLVKGGKGLYRTYHENYALKAEGNVRKGKKIGDWQGFRNDGTVFYRDVYNNNGRFVNGTSYDKLGREYTYKTIEQPSMPDGGYKAFYELVAKNMKYPHNARKSGIQGVVYVKFVVEGDGSLTHIKVVKGIDPECDEEAANAVALSSKWSPPFMRGQSVRLHIILPITFRLDI